MAGEGEPGGIPGGDEAPATDDAPRPSPYGPATGSPYGPATGTPYGPATGTPPAPTPAPAPATAAAAAAAAEAPAPAPHAEPAPDEAGRVAVVAGAVVAVASLLPVLNWVAWIAVPVPLVLGIVGLRRRPRRRSAVGIGLSLLAALLTAVLAPFYAGQTLVGSWSGAAGSGADPTPTYVDEEAARVTPFTLTYEVTGTAAGVQIISSDGVQLHSGIEVLEEQPLPWTRDIDVRVTRDARAVPVSLLLSALVPEEGGDVACRILVGDEVISTGSASGPGEYAECATDAYALRGFVP
ncbi:hypothetical protein ITJ44_08035 [Clavibacter sp. VKM Ac-2873]|uniref:hypothetical protein n=1 Tax=Clavibacter sp. VKM Ac-2873 TaxID=2783813 RepID=UPI00188B6DFA|nr:hypothetical protein [Clavibacter sp. VKM Ac-2873]MBF4618020.1 hypothetical protein [Clavibacter sp. VKM Ac-2873]